MQYLDFKREHDEATTSWERGDPVATLVECTGSTTYLVALSGGEMHVVEYGKERGTRVGGCNCKGFEFRDDEDSPYAHLYVLRKAEWLHNHLGDATGRDIADDPITAHDTIEHVVPNATEPEPDLVADGGEDFLRQSCHRCSAVSSDGEAPPPAECPEGTTDDPEHKWTSAPDLVADGDDIVEVLITGHNRRVFGRPEDQLRPASPTLEHQHHEPTSPGAHAGVHTPMRIGLLVRPRGGILPYSVSPPRLRITNVTRCSTEAPYEPNEDRADREHNGDRPRRRGPEGRLHQRSRRVDRRRHPVPHGGGRVDRSR